MGKNRRAKEIKQNEEIINLLREIRDAATPDELNTFEGCLCGCDFGSKEIEKEFEEYQDYLNSI